MSPDPTGAAPRKLTHFPASGYADNIHDLPDASQADLLAWRSRYQLLLAAAVQDARNAAAAAHWAAAAYENPFARWFGSRWAARFMSLALDGYGEFGEIARRVGPPPEYLALTAAREKPYLFGTACYSSVAKAAEVHVGEVWRVLDISLWEVAGGERPDPAGPPLLPPAFGFRVFDPEADGPPGVYSAAARGLSRYRWFTALRLEDRHWERLTLDLEAEYAAAAWLGAHPNASPVFPVGEAFELPEAATPAALPRPAGRPNYAAIYEATSKGGPVNRFIRALVGQDGPRRARPRPDIIPDIWGKNKKDRHDANLFDVTLGRARTKLRKLSGGTLEIQRERGEDGMLEAVPVTLAFVAVPDIEAQASAFAEPDRRA